MFKSNTMNDILTEEDVRLMVNSFYDKVKEDELLSPVFNDHAKIDWEAHLPKMYKFWNAVILAIPGYSGSPFPPHALLPVNPAHFDRWVSLFVTNIDEHFSGPNAESTKDKARNVAKVFQYKMGLLQ